MSATVLKIQKHPEVLAFVENFNVDSVILDNYFYAGEKNLFSQFEYSNEEIALILNLTDKEYTQTLQDFFSSTSILDENALRDIETIKKKIEDLENVLQESRSFEEAQKQLNQVDLELKKLNMELNIFNEFDVKQREAEEEFAGQSHLAKYNLNKIQEDIISINNRLQEIEQSLLDSKKEYIGYNVTRSSYDKGKIILATGWLIGVVLICAALYILNISILIVAIGGVAGLLVSIILFFTAKIESEYPENIPDQIPFDAQSAELEIQQLKIKKSQLLNLVGVRSQDEFFQAKAQYSAYEKKLTSIRELKENLLRNSQNFTFLKEQQQKLETEAVSLQDKLSRPEKLLSPEQYLSSRREIDTLRMDLNQKVSKQGSTKETLKLKLEDLRKELVEKIPDYISLLQQTYVSSLQAIDEAYSDWCRKLSLPYSPLDETCSNYDSLLPVQRILLQFLLIENIYKENFVFISLDNGSWSEQDIYSFDSFVSSIDMRTARFYLLKSNQ